MLEIISHNTALEKIGMNNGYINYKQLSSHKVSFKIELGLLNFNSLDGMVIIYII